MTTPRHPTWFAPRQAFSHEGHVITPTGERFEVFRDDSYWGGTRATTKRMSLAPDLSLGPSGTRAQIKARVGATKFHVCLTCKKDHKVPV